MLLQSLLLVVTLAIIGSALLTSTLVSAKAKFHAAIVQTARSAMTDATAEFIAWTQSNIRYNGIDQLSVWAAKPQTSSREPACSGATSATLRGTSSNCKLYQTISWNITGFTEVSDEFRSTNSRSEATNLAVAQNERRISATINIDITDSTGSMLYSRQSRELTARVFHAFPYVAVSGERDTSSESGSISTAEGDTAGFAKDLEDGYSPSEAPKSSVPASYTKTTLLTTIACQNSVDNLATNPEIDNDDVMFARLREFGNLAWIYEVPCRSNISVDPNTAPIGYKPATDNIYGNHATYDINWRKDDDNQSTFAR